jgi:hypothetical protein
MSAKDLPAGRAQTLNVRRIRRIHRHAVESKEDSTPESISDTDDWLCWDGDFDYPNDSQENWAADDESHKEHHNGIKHPECPEQQDVSAVPNVPGLVWPTQRSK